MFLVGIFSWWYSRGWLEKIEALRLGIAKTYDQFSIGILFQTLFYPFKQISSQQVAGSLLQRFIDKTISRGVGFMVRLFTILAGTIIITVRFFLACLVIVGWPLVPLLPIACVVLYALGVQL